MPLLRYEYFSNDVSSLFSATSYYTIGLDYWPVKNVNVKLNYSLIQNIDELEALRIVSHNRVSALLSFRF